MQANFLFIGHPDGKAAACSASAALTFGYFWDLAEEILAFAYS
jgi:hypothetical protein